MGVPVVPYREDRLPQDVLRDAFARLTPRESLTVYMFYRGRPDRSDILFLAPAGNGGVVVRWEVRSTGARTYSTWAEAALRLRLDDMAIERIDVGNRCQVDGCTFGAMVVVGGGYRKGAFGILSNVCTPHALVFPECDRSAPHEAVLFHAARMGECEAPDCDADPEMSSGAYRCDMPWCDGPCYHMADLCRAHGVARDAHAWANISA